VSQEVFINMLPGVKIWDLKKMPDERGFFAELFREDWKEFIGNDRVAQLNFSISYPGIIRAWHRHGRGQIDYLAVLRGALKICAFDDTEGSKTRGQLDEIVSSGEKLQMVRIPGHYWHGTKALGNELSILVYITTKLYDYSNPDEERRPWNDPMITDPKTGKPFDWNKPPYK
jgi:dTDP-4-dehydrorhamnose 3,5-epimerase